MSILEKLPDDPQREIELLRELVKSKDALIHELSKRPIASPPVYVPYPTYPTWGQPSYPWKYSSDQWTVTTGTTGTIGTATTSGTAIISPAGVPVGGKTRYSDGSETTWGVLMPK